MKGILNFFKMASAVKLVDKAVLKVQVEDDVDIDALHKRGIALFTGDKVEVDKVSSSFFLLFNENKSYQLIY